VEILGFSLGLKVNKRKLNQEGQSTVEFALTMILFFSFMLFFLQICLVFSFGSYVHYATFMSARAYLSSGPDQSDQMRRAKSVMGAMLKQSATQTRTDKFPMIAKGDGGDGDFPGLNLGQGELYRVGDRAYSWMEGVRYTFKSRLFLIPFGRPDASSSRGNSISLTSESWLGREPTSSECSTWLNRMKGNFDNGC
jgi:hypothetical protein